MKIGVFVPIGNNGWLISTHAPQYMPTFELNKAIVQKAEHYHFDFALSMIKLRGFGGKTEFWDHNLESFTLMAGLAAVTSRIQIYATAATLTLPPAIVARMAATIDSISGGRFGVNLVTGWQKPEYEQMGIWPGDDYFSRRYDYLTEYENLDELNHLAHLIFELDSDEIETLGAALNKGDHTSSVADIINLVHNLDCYDLHPGVTDDETLGRIYVEDMELLDVPDNVLPYFDFEAYGRDMRINEGGHFAPGGYVFNNGGSFVERYHGMEDIPPEHRIFAYPKLNIREQMAAYQEVIDRSALNEEKQRLPASREDR